MSASLDGAPVAAADALHAGARAGGRAPGAAGRPASAACRPARARRRSVAGRRRPAPAPKACSTSAPTSKLPRPDARAQPGLHLARARSAPPAHSAPAWPPARRRPGRASRHGPPPRRGRRGAASSTGRQSATCTVQATPGSVGPRRRRPRRRARRQRGAGSRTTCAPCTWRSHTGRAPSAAAKRRRFSATAAASSPTATPRFRLAQGAALTPPARVLISAPTRAGTCQSGHSSRPRARPRAQAASGQASGRVLLEGVELHAGVEHAHHVRHVVEPAVEALGVEDLRHQHAVGQRRRVAVAEAWPAARPAGAPPPPGRSRPSGGTSGSCRPR